MSIYLPHMRSAVIRPALKHMGLYSRAAEELLVLTCATESAGGRYLVQKASGPAMGIFQMEPATHDDIYANYLPSKPHLLERLSGFGADCAEDMATNLLYAAAMARLHYLRIPKPLPDPANPRAMASYWKLHYNTPAGKGQVGAAIGHYQMYLGSGEDA